MNSDHRIVRIKRIVLVMALIVGGVMTEVGAQSRAHHLITKVDSLLANRYYKANIDTAYIIRPLTKWTIRARVNMSGTMIRTEGIEQGAHFKSEMEADHKMTISVGVSYLGFSLNASLNPAKLLGKYRDYELNFNSYGKRFGFEFSYQNAHNFNGWHETDGQERVELPADMLSVKTLNANIYYVFNNRRFSYPAAFSQSYIQRKSAGSLLLALSGQGQHATLNWDQKIQLKMANIGIGAGYGYNYVPKQGWLLHISALPTFIVYSHTSMTFGDDRLPFNYHFPEAIITGRGAVVRQINNKFLGMTMVYNFTNIGYEKELAIHNVKWYVRAFFGMRL